MGLFQFQFLAADLEKAGLTGEVADASADAERSRSTSATQRNSHTTAAAAAPPTVDRARSVTDPDVAAPAPAWGRAVEQLSHSNPSSAPPSSHYADDAQDEEYEGYAYSDEDEVDTQSDDRVTDSGTPAWLSGKRAHREEPDAPTNARPYSTNLTGVAQLQGEVPEWFEHHTALIHLHGYGVHVNIVRVISPAARRQD